MPFNFTILSDELHVVANSAIKHLAMEQGIAQKRFNIEEPFHNDIDYRPTAWALTADGHYLCIEAGWIPHILPLDAFLLQCKNQGVPVKLWVAIPLNSNQSGGYAGQAKWAKDNGVGVVAIGAGTPSMLNEPLSTSLTGVRPLQSWNIPQRFRSSLGTARNTFVSGDPLKGGSRVYDELEAATRKLAQKLHSKGLLPLSGGGRSTPINIEKRAWFNLIDYMRAHVDFGASKSYCPGLTTKLLSRIGGLTDPRNDTNHKLTQAAAVAKRDLRLRTRFEEGIDALTDLLSACPKLRL